MAREETDHVRGGSREGAARILLGVFFLSASLLLLEVLFVRLVSILLYPVSTYLVISLALLGFGISGTALALRRSGRPLTPSQASMGAVAFAAATLLALVDVWLAGRSSVAAVLLPVALGLPFACGGMAIALALSLPGTPVHRVYFADLFGAGLGAGAFLIGMNLVGGVNMGIAIAGLGLVAAGLFAAGEAAWRRRVWPLVGVGVVLVGILIPLPPGITSIAPKELRFFNNLGADVRWEYQGWSSIARVDVLSLPGDRIELPQAFEYKLVTQDGGAPSILLDIPDLETADLIDHSILGIPYWISSSPRVMIIGLGGGPDVQAALSAGATSVTGVEINPQMIKIVDEVFADFVHHLYDDPRVTVIEGDGRHVVRLSDETFDVIQLTGVDTSVASLGANPNLAENYLYTVEAFREFYQHLSPDGVLSVSFPDANGLGLRLVATVAAALQAEGVDDPGQQIVVSTTAGFAHVLAKRGSFTAAEVEILTEHFDSGMLGLYFPLYHRLFGTPEAAYFAEHAVLYAPGLVRPGLYADFFAALQAGQSRAFLSAQERTVLPPSDDWPFFFVLDKWGYFTPNLGILVLTIGLLFVASAVFILTPPLVRRRRGLSLPGAPALVPYFFALGLGYILVEVVLIQKLSLFLGHPSYSLSVTLCTLLAASGLGSWASGRGLRSGQIAAFRRRIGLATVGVALAVLVAALALTPLFDLLLRWPLAARIMVGVAVVAVPGFLMGMPFPTGLAAVKDRAPTFVPWAWAINSTATVIGTILAVLLAMLYGFTVVFATAGGLYLLAAGSALIYFRPSAPI
ncbi:MAG: methyltransferase domain-containing protein [Anaerolineae bacterium]